MIVTADIPRRNDSQGRSEIFPLEIFRADQVVALLRKPSILRRSFRFALELGRLNPHWDDERTYQETRHILAGMVQYIVYHEYLPMALGPDIISTYNLTLVEDVSVDPPAFAIISGTL